MIENKEISRRGFGKRWQRYEQFFSRNPMSLLDMVNNTKANPMNWVRVADEILPALN